ncbi:hypothetical protein PPYR_12730 [Photinus pyralis]|uniref:Uncharacterized protein n=2 Tax=Photinus pyralis TaxID=7054 RepID=A0A5N4A704_PHOPY|nr:uncharacterized protein LOC116179236 [Photinus pyralis]KAB0793110.1 hypothetical protein PPYR_12730 [Photinus pyralis]
MTRKSSLFAVTSNMPKKNTTQTKAPSKTQTRWADNDDMENDLYSISCFGQQVKDPPAPSIHVRKPVVKSVYDLDDFDSEQMPVKAFGRGRMMQNIKGSDFLKRTSEISQEIRLTQSGYGYCNDQIEHALNCDTIQSSVRSSPQLSETASRSSTPNNVATSRPLMPLCDIVRSGVRARKVDVHTPTEKNPINLSSLKEFPKL